MFNLEKAHFILDEMVMNGCIVETNKANVLKPIALMEKASEETLFSLIGQAANLIKMKAAARVCHGTSQHSQPSRGSAVAQPTSGCRRARRPPLMLPALKSNGHGGPRQAAQQRPEQCASTPFGFEGVSIVFYAITSTRFNMYPFNY